MVDMFCVYLFVVFACFLDMFVSAGAVVFVVY